MFQSFQSSTGKKVEKKNKSSTNKTRVHHQINLYPPGKWMAQLPCIHLSWFLTKPLFGSCAIYFHHTAIFTYRHLPAISQKIRLHVAKGFLLMSFFTAEAQASYSKDPAAPEAPLLSLQETNQHLLKIYGWKM